MRKYISMLIIVSYAVSCSRSPELQLQVGRDQNGIYFDIQKNSVIRGLLSLTVETAQGDEVWSVDMNYYSGSSVRYGEVPRNIENPEGRRNAEQEFPKYRKLPNPLEKGESYVVKIACQYDSSIGVPSVARFRFTVDIDEKGNINTSKRLVAVDMAQKSSMQDKLTTAAMKGNLEKIKELEGNGADLDVADPNFHKRTPLIVSALYGHERVVEYLLDRGADPGKSDDQGNTALIFSIWNDSTNIARALLRHDHSLREDWKLISGIVDRLPPPSQSKWQLILKEYIQTNSVEVQTEEDL
jgi:hypothetical protein